MFASAFPYFEADAELGVHISQYVFFSISVFLNLCDSQLVFFSICAILNLCNSQLVFFSIKAIWARHHQLDDSLVGQLTSVIWGDLGTFWSDFNYLRMQNHSV